MPGIRIFIAAVLICLSGCAGQTGGIYHTVEKGETLYRIGRVYGVDDKYLARLNGINDPTRLEVGRRIYIPGADSPRRVAGVPSAGSSSPPPARATSPPAASRPSTAAVSQAPARTPTPAGPSNLPPAAPRSEPRPNPAKGLFSWPVQGKVLTGFGSDGAQNRKGVEIGVAPGTPVLSSAAGKVTYSGDGIRGYGNLVILRHDDSYFTVYAYNQKNLVEAGAYVGKGERIALSGVPPSGGEPRLHFEIRQGQTAVNPILYLP